MERYALVAADDDADIISDDTTELLDPLLDLSVETQWRHVAIGGSSMAGHSSSKSFMNMRMTFPKDSKSVMS